MGVLFEKITQKDHILAAYHLICEQYFDPDLKIYQKYVPGIDGLDFREFERELEEHLEECRQFLLKGDRPFYPQILRKIPKEKPGEFREIYVSSLRDKVIQRVMADPIADYLEHHLYPNLYSYRQGKYYGTIAAACKGREILKENPGGVYVFKTDISSYYDNINQRKLLEKFEAILPDEPELLNLLEKFVHQRECCEGILFSPILGVPQGSSLSPLSSNLYLAELDGLMFRKGFHYLRYADDILLLAANRETLDEGRALIREIVAQHELELSEKKTIIRGPNQPFEYLGYRFERGKVMVGSNGVRKYRRWVREQLPRYRYQNEPNKTPEERRKLLRQVLIDLNTATEQGLKQLPWIRCFPVIDDDRRLKDLDRYIKDRIRLCVTGRASRRNYQAVPEAWFRELGYKSLTGAYYRIHFRRPLGPYRGWRRYFGTDFEDHLAEHERKPYLVRKWRELKYRIRFVRKALDGQWEKDRKSDIQNP